MLEIAAVEDEAAELARATVDLLAAHAAARGHPFEVTTVAFEARWNGERVGGVHASLVYRWLLIKYLGVVDGHRGRGVGTALLQRIEGDAVGRGALGVFVDTYGFQAPRLYTRLGYEELGRLPTPDPARTRIFFRKVLADGAG